MELVTKVLDNMQCIRNTGNCNQLQNNNSFPALNSTPAGAPLVRGA
jgi:hypothetical protein